MNANLTFDTLEYMSELKKAGIKHEEAEAITKATVKAFSQMLEMRQLTTREDLYNLKTDLQYFIVKSITTAIFILGSMQTFLHFFQ